MYILAVVLIGICIGFAIEYIEQKIYSLEQDVESLKEELERLRSKYYD